MMIRELAYMSGIIAVGFAVNYTLRALPFILFAGRDRALPGWVEKFGNAVSPVIIAALIVYSYSGLQWKTAWPYLAGALTVGLQLWKRNPLASILGGTVLYMCLVGLTGCASVPVETVRSTRAHPLVHVTKAGLLYRDKAVRPEDLAKRLEKDAVPKNEALHVLVDPDFEDQHVIWVLQHNYLNRAGYTRAIVMLGEQRGVSGTSELRESFQSKGTVVPYEKRFQKKGTPPAWKK